MTDTRRHVIIEPKRRKRVQGPPSLRFKSKNIPARWRPQHILFFGRLGTEECSPEQRRVGPGVIVLVGVGNSRRVGRRLRDVEKVEI